MADGEVGHVLTAKVGPLPLVLWVVGGASVIFVVMLMRNKGSSGAQANQTNAVTALAPTEAEAFGTMEQQQQDVVNALSTLGNNQSALGGSMSTLTGIVTQQGADNAAAFQNLVNGQQQIQQGQTDAATASSNYYSSLLSNLTNYANSIGSQLNGINSNVGQSAAFNQTWLGYLVGASQANQAALGNISGQIGQGQQFNNTWLSYLVGASQANQQAQNNLSGQIAGLNR